MPNWICRTPAGEVTALQDIYIATNGSSWNWKTDYFTYGPLWTFNDTIQEDPCADNSTGQLLSWQGITCNYNPVDCSLENITCSIISLSLSQYGLSGTIPSSISRLTASSTLLLSSNSLIGTIPPELGQLSSLQTIYLDRNSFDGIIPTSFGLLINLREIALYENKLVGPLPSALGSLIKLRGLWVHLNRLTGGIPSVLSSLSLLQTLSIGSNSLNGTIPSSIGYITNIVVFSARNNCLDGSIPTELGGLKQISSLSLSYNSLVGSIPTAIGSLVRLTSFTIDNNCLIGQVPTEVGRLIRLQYFISNNNQLVGTIPTVFGGFMSSLLSLELSFNSLRGQIPTELGSRTRLQTLSLNDNSLSGPISATLMAMSSLVQLTLQNNCLVGSIPSEIGSLVSLQYLDINGNKLTGKLPTGLSSLKYLEKINLDDNKILGSIPSVYGRLVSLNVFTMRHNFLTGILPPTIGELSELQYLSVSANCLRGVIPSTIGILSRTLQLLSLDENQLSGTLPSSFGCLSNLQILNLGFNKIGGSIPPEIGYMSSLECFSMPAIMLHGSIPSELGELSSLTSLMLFNNSLTGSLPESLASCTKLQHVSFANNFLSGQLPDGVGAWSNVSIIDFSNNNLVGTIPESIGFLRKMRYLLLFKNNIGGTIPIGLSNAHSLKTIDLSQNILSGYLSEGFFDNLISLEQLKLYNNKLTGAIPSSLFLLSSLLSLQIQNNRISKFPYSKDLYECRNLTTLDISDNQMSHSLPPDLFKLPRLTNFIAGKNCFTGELPETLCFASSLQVLILDGLSQSSDCKSNYNIFSSAKISGSVPPCLYSLSNLQVLHASDNALYGSLGLLSESKLLTEVVFSNNHLSGDVPEEYLSSLRILDLSNNRIDGTISGNKFPDDTLKLKLNRLSGHIPSEVSSVNELEILEGNLFSCSSVNNLPYNDRDRDYIVCDSTDLDYALYYYAGLFAFIFCLLGWFIFSESSQIANRFLASQRFMERMNPYLRRVPAFTRFLLAYNDIIRIIIFAGIFTSSSMLIAAIVLKDDQIGDYGTHSFQYRWLITLVMLSGYESATCVLLLWILTISIIFYLLIAQSRTFNKSFNFIQTFSDTRTGQSVDYIMEDYQTQFYNETSKTSIVIAVLNVMINVSINIWYISGVIPHSEYSTLLAFQVGIALFKLLWKSIMMSTMQCKVHFKQLSRRIIFFTAVAFANEVLIPSVIFLCFDSNCFKSIFFTDSDVTSSYSFVDCLVYDIDPQTGDRACLYKGETIFSTTYSPLFTYNYQCGTALIEAFTPVIFIGALLSSFHCIFFSLFAHADDMLLVRFDNSFTKLFFPKSLLPSEDFEALLSNGVAPSRKYRSDAESIIKIPELVSNQLNYLVVILTFGMCAPYVAFSVSIAAVLDWLKTFSYLSAFISRRTKRLSVSPTSIFTILDQICIEITESPFETMRSSLIFTSGLFFGLFLVDMCGDNSNSSRKVSFWFLGATISVSLGLIFGWKLYISPPNLEYLKYLFQCLFSKKYATYNSDDEKDNDRLSSVEVASISSIASNPIISMAASDENNH